MEFGAAIGSRLRAAAPSTYDVRSEPEREQRVRRKRGAEQREPVADELCTGAGPYAEVVQAVKDAMRAVPQEQRDHREQ